MSTLYRNNNSIDVIIPNNNSLCVRSTYHVTCVIMTHLIDKYILRSHLYNVKASLALLK